MGFFLSSKFKKPDIIPEELIQKPKSRNYNHLIAEKDPDVLEGDYKKFEPYTDKWMGIWKYHKNLQEEMLEDARARNPEKLYVLW